MNKIINHANKITYIFKWDLYYYYNLKDLPQSFHCKLL